MRRETGDECDQIDEADEYNQFIFFLSPSLSI
jgi:hypothetical protein